jgi:hypothetical protein
MKTPAIMKPCCVCKNPKSKILKGVGGDIFHVCSRCRSTLAEIDDLSDSGRTFTINETKRLLGIRITHKKLAVKRTAKKYLFSNEHPGYGDYLKPLNYLKTLEKV